MGGCTGEQSRTVRGSCHGVSLHAASASQGTARATAPLPPASNGSACPVTADCTYRPSSQVLHTPTHTRSIPLHPTDTNSIFFRCLILTRSTTSVFSHTRSSTVLLCLFVARGQSIVKRPPLFQISSTNHSRHDPTTDTQTLTRLSSRPHFLTNIYPSFCYTLSRLLS